MSESDPTQEVVSEETWTDTHGDEVTLTIFSDGVMLVTADTEVELVKEQVRQIREWLLVHSQP